MSQLTRRQHTVPDFYLTQLAPPPPDGRINRSVEHDSIFGGASHGDTSALSVDDAGVRQVPDPAATARFGIECLAAECFPEKVGMRRIGEAVTHLIAEDTPVRIDNPNLKRFKELVLASDQRITLINGRFEDLAHALPDLVATTERERHAERFHTLREAGAKGGARP
jgi:hypothetical protein